MQYTIEQADYLAAIRKCFEKANQLFGTDFSLANVEVDFSIKGRCAGRAYPKHYSACGTKYLIPPLVYP